MHYLASTTGTRPILIGYLMGVENINDGFGLNSLCWGLGNLISIPLAGNELASCFFPIFESKRKPFYTQDCFTIYLVITKLLSTLPALLSFSLV